MVLNTKFWAPLVALTALAPLVSADVEFTLPKAGDLLDAGSTITVEWKESKTEPLLTDLLTYQLFLCWGGNDVFVCPLDLTVGAKPYSLTGNQASGLVGVGEGGNTKNAYFLKMVSVAIKGGTVTNYSPRFSYQKMTGTFNADIQTALKTVKGTDSPDRVDATSDTAEIPEDGVYDVEYTMQTGATRYAPMQALPPTKITKKDTQPLHPTSSVSLATAPLPSAKQQTTLTQSQTFSIKSVANTAAAAPMPSDDMAKFLNRWKD